MRRRKPRITHMGAEVCAAGAIAPLCTPGERTRHPDRWTLRAEAVSCERCKALLSEATQFPTQSHATPAGLSDEPRPAGEGEMPNGEGLTEGGAERARQDSNLRPLAPEAHATGAGSPGEAGDARGSVADRVGVDGGGEASDAPAPPVIPPVGECPTGVLLDALIAALPVFVSRDAYRKSLGSPGVQEWGGEPWTFAVNGRVMLAIRGAHLAPDWVTPPDFPSCGTVVPPTPAGPLPRLDLAALKTYLGLPADAPLICARCEGAAELPCPECGGDGGEVCTCRCGNEHSAECSRCWGSGDVPCPECCADGIDRVSPFLLGMSRFDKRIVAVAVRALPNAVVRVAQVAAERATTLIGDGWFVLIMPLSDLAGGEAPRFELLPAEVA